MACFPNIAWLFRCTGPYIRVVLGVWTLGVSSALSTEVKRENGYRNDLKKRTSSFLCCHSRSDHLRLYASGQLRAILLLSLCPSLSSHVDDLSHCISVINHSVKVEAKSKMPEFAPVLYWYSHLSMVVGEEMISSLHWIIIRNIFKNRSIKVWPSQLWPGTVGLVGNDPGGNVFFTRRQDSVIWKMAANCFWTWLSLISAVLATLIIAAVVQIGW